jgi:hypothetical protein
MKLALLWVLLACAPVIAEAPAAKKVSGCWAIVAQARSTNGEGSEEIFCADI